MRDRPRPLLVCVPALAATPLAAGCSDYRLSDDPVGGPGDDDSPAEAGPVAVVSRGLSDGPATEPGGGARASPR